MELRLTRTEISPDGVFGTLILPAEIEPPYLQLATCEDDWKDNQPLISCIPAGHYRLHRTMWQKYGIETFQIMDVPGRDHILIHYGNTEEDVEGCVLVGLRRGKILVARDEDTGATNTLKEGVVNSRLGFRHFMDVMQWQDEATLDIVWSSGVFA